MQLLKLNAKINALKDENMRKERILADLHAKVALTDRVIMNEDNSHQARQIRVLENRIDKAMIKLNEAQSIKKTYESILARLKEERIGFDKSLSELESELKVKKKDHDELVLLLHDAIHAKELAHAELHRFEQAVMEERNQRDREVMEKRLLVQKRVEMNQLLDSRGSAVHKAPPPAQQPPLITPPPPPIIPTKSSTHNRHHRELQEYEEAYNRLKDATGVSDVNEIIQKFVNQETAHKNLTRRISEQEDKFESLVDQYDAITNQLDEIKFSNAGVISSGMNRKQALEDIEKHRVDSMIKLEKNRAKYEKFAQVMVDVNSGVSHLMHKLSCIRVSDDSTSGMMDYGVELNDDTIEEVLTHCEGKIGKLVSICSHIQAPPEVVVAQPDPEIRVRITKEDAGKEFFHLEDIEDDSSLFLSFRKTQAHAAVPAAKKSRTLRKS